MNGWIDTGLIALWMGTAAFVQDGGKTKPDAPVAPVDESRSEATADPFQPDEALRALLNGESAPTEFVPLKNRPVLPRMKLKGVLKMRKRAEPAAVIEVEGVGNYVVRRGGQVRFSMDGHVVEDNQVSLSPLANVVRQQIPIVLKVDEVSADGVVVQVGTLGETLVIK